ncbi:MAG: hypothetical protein ACRDCI_12655, partial [Plesiomonas shigelloides]
MSLEQEICNNYANLLTGMFLVIGNRGSVLFPNENNDHVEVDGCKLYLPTEENLDSRDLKDAVFFHPLCEDALHGQSKMIHFLTRRVLAANSLRLDLIVQAMFDLAKNPAKQKSIKSAEAIKYLTIIKDMKDDTAKKWTKLVTEMSENDGLFSIYLNRNKKLDDVLYARMCVVEIPVISDEQPGAILCGVNVHSKANKEMFRNLLTEIFKDMPLEFGSNHTVPYFHALMEAHRTITKRLNNITALFKGAIDLPQINTEWFEDLLEDNFSKYHRMIPDLKDNTGTDVKSIRDTEDEKSGKRVDNLPNAARGGKTVSLDDLDRTNSKERDRERDSDRRGLRDDRRDRRDSDYDDYLREVNGRGRDDRDDRDDRYSDRRDRRDRYDDRRDRRGRYDDDDRYDDRGRRDRMRDGFGSR